MQESTPTIDARQERIIAELERREDWFDKYEYLIARGKAHPTSGPELHCDPYALQGCQSNVWVRAEVRDGTIHYTADSDSMITRGMIALVLDVLQGVSPPQAARADLYFIERTGLDRNLSPARANGLKTIASQMQGLARDAC
jgi:cysteine desulfuration protein SufE